MLLKYMADVDVQVGEACLDPKGPPQGASLQEAAPQAGRPTHKARQHQPIEHSCCLVIYCHELPFPSVTTLLWACVEMLRCRNMNAPRQVWAMPLAC